MEVLSYSKVRQTLAEVMRAVNADHTPVHVTQKSGDDVVILSKTDYSSMQETMYLMSSPANAARLNAAIGELEGGKGIERELVEQ
jgi:antitoxin YefM